MSRRQPQQSKRERGRQRAEASWYVGLNCTICGRPVKIERGIFTSNVDGTRTATHIMCKDRARGYG